MAICDPCKNDRCSEHRSHETVEIRRKGHLVRSKTVTCEHVCLQPEGWRGESQPVPKWGLKE